MSLSITKRQKEMLSTIYKYIRGTGYPPTFEEMRELLGVSSNQSVIDLLNKLEEKKIIKRSESSARSITILPFGYEILGERELIPFLGVSHAGAPIEVAQIDGDWQPLPGEISKLKDEVFVLRVFGDSMINAGIDDGDDVLVKNQKEYVSGDIVLAEVDGESTIKKFISDDKPPFVYLMPENPNYDVIPFTESVCLRGKVIHIIKNANN